MPHPTKRSVGCNQCYFNRTTAQRRRTCEFHCLDSDKNTRINPVDGITKGQDARRHVYPRIHNCLQGWQPPIPSPRIQNSFNNIWIDTSYDSLSEIPNSPEGWHIPRNRNWSRRAWRGGIEYHN